MVPRTAAAAELMETIYSDFILTIHQLHWVHAKALGVENGTCYLFNSTNGAFVYIDNE